MRAFRAEYILAACIIVLAVAYLGADAALPAAHIGDPLGPKAFPALVGGGLIVSALLLLLEIRKKRRAMEAAGGAMPPKAPVDKRQMTILLIMVAWTALYYTVFEKLGYLIATPIFLLGLLSHHHRGHHVTNLLVAFGFTAVVYLLFSQLLGVPLPSGPLPF